MGSLSTLRLCVSSSPSLKIERSGKNFIAGCLGLPKRKEFLVPGGSDSPKAKAKSRLLNFDPLRSQSRSNFVSAESMAPLSAMLQDLPKAMASLPGLNTTAVLGGFSLLLLFVYFLKGADRRQRNSGLPPLPGNNSDVLSIWVKQKG